jgi:hypothetical protein
MSMPGHARSPAGAPARSLRTRVLGVLLAATLGVGTALLVSACGGSTGKGLIPAADAGPLQSDFEAVSQEAQNGDGSCTGTQAALTKTEQDFDALPATLDSGLRDTLHQGIANLRARALALCAQPLASTTTTATTKATTTPTTTTSTTPTLTQTTSTTETPPTETPTQTPEGGGGGGGTPAPGETPGVGGGTGVEEGGGVAGGASPGAGTEAGSPGAAGGTGQEGAGK